MSSPLPYIQSKDTATRLKKYLWFTLRLAISGLAIYMIATQVMHKDWSTLTAFPKSSHYWLFVLIAAGLVFLNWGLEIEKWRFLVSRTDLVSFKQASHPVLTGLTMNWIVPWSFGDLLMRLKGHKSLKNGALAIFINRFTALSTTLFFGAIGAASFILQERGANFLNGPFWFGVAVAMILVLALVMGSRALFISIMRYSVFSLQFFFLLQPLLPEVPWAAVFCGIFWTFLLKSIVPSLFGGFGVREVSAIAFFSLWSAPVQVVLVPSLVLWILNIVLPSMAGIPLLLREKLRIA